ncbi:ectonucleotide pyrophosphatase phosphodiesterase [Halocaridina rubra]|uniref:Ectonucleotide pyrophosphatase phosphodiesterase n=1 Tax=Halocaridina rubra TaxID=373956 RepID=A0AAN8WMZ7_HALRR
MSVVPFLRDVYDLNDLLLFLCYVKVVLVVAGLLLRWAAANSNTVHDPPVLPDQLDPLTCPPTYENHPLIFVSMDGFRADYLTRDLTPTIMALGSKGVKAPYMKPSYPTITFPNHYTLVTGLYPPYHGIIANKFYDPVFNAEFRVGRPESFKKRWWGGEPIWKTVKNQGKKSASFFWPGSEVDDNHPDYWLYYNESIPFTRRVEQVLAWLDLPPPERPSYIGLYMHEPDGSGHDFGPYSREINEALITVDSMMKLLVEGLQVRNLLSCVNLLVVADHGMAEAGDNRVIRLDDYIPNVVSRSRFWKGAFVRLQPHDNSPETKADMMNALSCQRPEMRVYEKTTLPIRWHMNNQRSVEDIVLDVDAGYSVGGDSSFKADAGEHGYDNFFSVMNALFVAHGPDFQRHVEVEAFQNIELYNLMCHLMGVQPAPNNGTWGALHHMLAHPPPSPLPKGLERIPELAVLPREENIEEHLKNGWCEGDDSDDDDWLDILANAQDNARYITYDHFPWGVPSLGTFKDSTLLLVHQDTVTAYSTPLKMPLWTSFTTSGHRKGSKPVPWRSDVRLEKEDTPTCISYDTLLPHNISRYPLFHPEFSTDENFAQLPFLISNALPFTHQLAHRWNELRWLVKDLNWWLGDLNIILGPVFDYNSDTFVDDLEWLA